MNPRPDHYVAALREIVEVGNLVKRPLHASVGGYLHELAALIESNPHRPWCPIAAERVLAMVATAVAVDDVPNAAVILDIVQWARRQARS